MPKLKKLSLKQSRFLKEYFRTGNGLRSALKVYNCKDARSAQTIASQNLSKLIIPIKDLMEAKKLSLGDLIDDVQEMRKAKKIVTSHTEPDYERPDWSARAKAIDIASKWLGLGTPDQLTQVKVDVKPILGGRSQSAEAFFDQQGVNPEDLADKQLDELIRQRAKRAGMKIEDAEVVKPEPSKPEPEVLNVGPHKKHKKKPSFKKTLKAREAPKPTSEVSRYKNPFHSEEEQIPDDTEKFSKGNY